MNRIKTTGHLRRRYLAGTAAVTLAATGLRERPTIQPARRLRNTVRPRDGLHILVPPPGPGLYLTHAWVWANNPDGMFADWNPEITCS